MLMPVLIGSALTHVILNRWQHQKDKSQIRSQILKDYQESFKNYIILMDTFVGKIIFTLVTDSDTPNKKLPMLADMLSYGYNYDRIRNGASPPFPTFKDIRP